MKEKLFIILALVLVVVVLAALSAANYKQTEKSPDTEASPNRSTFNSGATGTQAFFSLLDETGHRVVRWQQQTAALLTAKPKDRPSVFVVVGYTRREFTKPEADALLDWVSSGGRLVLIDRDPPKALVKTSSMWTISTSSDESFEIYSVDPADQRQMTLETGAAKPVQPSLYTSGVNAVQISRFAGRVTFISQDGIATADMNEIEPTVAVSAEYSPAVHVAGGDANVVVDAPYGEGSVVILSDPFVVSNGGISLVDNARLAVNLVSAGDGLIAFDEYHQGYGADNNRFLQFFAGTPVVALFLQACLIVGALFYSQSRRFARPVPEPEADRLTKLEYIAAMAELQQRTRAYDLAIENIYSEFRRRVTPALGLNGLTAKPHDIAAAISSVTGDAAAKVETTLFKCEEIIRGEPTNKREVVRLTAELREIETRLGLHRRSGRKL